MTKLERIRELEYQLSNLKADIEKEDKIVFEENKQYVFSDAYGVYMLIKVRHGSAAGMFAWSDVFDRCWGTGAHKTAQEAIDHVSSESVYSFKNRRDLYKFIGEKA